MKGLLFITHRTSRFDYVQSTALALEGGCRQIQLRMKDCTSADEFESKARRVKKLCDDYCADLYINDKVEICLRIGAKGVHLGRNDMSPTEARALLGDGFVIGGTANTFEDVLRLNDAGVNYIGLGPFRFTGTKANLSPILGREGYAEVVRLCRIRGVNVPIMAIGGITAEDIPMIMSIGVAGVALSSSILNAENPKSETAKIINIIYNE